MPVACARWPSSPRTLVFKPPHLPLELTDQIIDVVAGLKVKKLRANLAACSPVCRTWMRRSRYHFFQSCRLLVHRENTLLFGELLRSPSCTILPFIETLTMRNNGESFFHQIQDALSLLMNLKSLRLCGWNWDAYDAPPARELLMSLGSVVDLEIDCPNLGEFDDALQLFCSLPSLNRLSIRKLKRPNMFCSWRSTPPTSFAPRVPLELVTPPHLSSLLLDTPALVPIIHWLNGVGSCRLTMLELCLPLMDPDDLGPLKQFIQSLSACLEHFSLRALSSKLFQAHLEDTFEFSAFKELQTCRFSNLFPGYLPSALEHSLSSIVRSITSSSLQNITFDLDGPFSDPFIDAFTRWDALDRFLAERSHLKSVGFACTPTAKSVGDDLYTKCVRDIQHAFPRISSMGLLDIHVERFK
ncbi:hypothetical protein C8R44DRAFT_245368 [Mycena epipterygia]|nr:hypothetical protein C8R44DRAFT_245368 [Mycena epipterygia]